MTRARLGVLCLSSRAAFTAAALVLAGCASGRSSPQDSVALDISFIQEIEVRTSGASIGCSAVHQQISGQALYATPAGDRRPVPDVEFWVVSGSERGRQLDVQVDGQGRFAGKVLLWNHEVGAGAEPDNTEFIPGWTIVALRAPGCDDATFEVGHDMPALTVTMTCPGRQ